MGRRVKGGGSWPSHTSLQLAECVHNGTTHTSAVVPIVTQNAENRNINNSACLHTRRSNATHHTSYTNLGKPALNSRGRNWVLRGGVRSPSDDCIPTAVWETSVRARFPCRGFSERDIILNGEHCGWPLGTSRSRFGVTSIRAATQLDCVAALCPFPNGNAGRFMCNRLKHQVNQRQTLNQRTLKLLKFSTGVKRFKLLTVVKLK